MTYQKAHEIMDFLQSCGISAEFANDLENSIDVYDDNDHFLFDIRTEEEWNALKKIFQIIVERLASPKSERRRQCNLQ
jgi:hypothetical protein